MGMHSGRACELVAGHTDYDTVGFSVHIYFVGSLFAFQTSMEIPTIIIFGIQLKTVPTQYSENIHFSYI